MVEDIIFRFAIPFVGIAIIVSGFLLVTGIFSLSQVTGGVVGGVVILVTTIALFPSFIFWLFHLGQK